MQRMMMGLTSLPLRGGQRTGARLPRKASNNLYQGATHATGYYRTEFKNKIKRQWKPNTQIKNLYSEVLNETFRVYMTVRAMRTMRRYGGLDEYVLSLPKKVLGAGFASDLKDRLETTVKTGVDPEKKILTKKQELFALARKDYDDRFELSKEMRTIRSRQEAYKQVMGPWPYWKGEEHNKLVMERTRDQDRGELFEKIRMKQKQLEAIEDEARQSALRLPPDELEKLQPELAILDEMPDNDNEDYFNVFDEAYGGEENFTQADHLEYERNKSFGTNWPIGPGGSTREGLVAPQLMPPSSKRN